MDKKQEIYLTQKFGHRVSMRRVERKLYGHDIAALPGLVKPFIGKTLPDAIVQPESEAELIELVLWAAENEVPLTPRGKASSGYGGVLPVKGGLVVDFWRMNRVTDIDAAGLTATAQAGAVWERVDIALMKNGLTLKLYPSSYPSATVGGWLAQGGAGIGSFEAGWFRENVVSARVVTPDGQVRVFTGDELDVIDSAEGTTGLISEVTLRVRPLEDLEVAAIGCSSADSLQRGVAQMIEKKLPIWSLVFINPRMAELRNEAPLREHLGIPAEKRVILPDSYITTIAFRKKDREAVMGGLPEIMSACGGQLLSDEIACHEWENRFKIMLVKRLGPSLVPGRWSCPSPAWAR
jgi:FAD/FMN-containing dehydrogenase